MTKYKQHGDYHVSLVNFLDRISIVFQFLKNTLVKFEMERNIPQEFSITERENRTLRILKSIN